MNLISATTTQTGLEVRAKLDTSAYPQGAKVSKKEIAEINIRPDSRGSPATHRRSRRSNVHPACPPATNLQVASLSAHPLGESSASKLLAASLTKSASFASSQLFQSTLLGSVARDLVLVCHSGGKSLHGWYACWDLTEEQNQKFFACLMAPGKMESARKSTTSTLERRWPHEQRPESSLRQRTVPRAVSTYQDLFAQRKGP